MADERIRLAGDDDVELWERSKAVKLWKQGRKAWNIWVEVRPNASIDFTGVTFEQTPNIPEDEWPFAGFKFPQKGNVSFHGAKFGDRDVSFNLAKFGEGKVSFDKAKFGKGEVSFEGAKFGGVYFNMVEFGEGRVSFRGAKFGGNAIFNALQTPGYITMFSFQYCSFDGPFSISPKYKKDVFNCVLDLRHTKTTHHVALNDFTCNPQTKFTPEDTGRLRRLKEIAEANKDHVKAMDFKALEMQSASLAKDTPKQALFFEFFFRYLSDYGRSILRPIIGLGVLWLLFATIYGHLLKTNIDDVGYVPIKVLSYSLSQIFLIFPSFIKGRKYWANNIFDSDCSSLLMLLSGLQNFLAVILIFLIILGLRNRFKI